MQLNVENLIVTCAAKQPPEPRKPESTPLLFPPMIGLVRPAMACCCAAKYTDSFTFYGNFLPVRNSPLLPCELVNVLPCS